MKRSEIRHALVLGLFLFTVGSLFSQTLEETIYAEVDALVAAPSEAKLSQLQPKITSWKQSISTANQHMALVILQSTMGFQYNRLNQTGEALKQYEDAWQRYDKQELNGYDIIEYCLKPLGNLYTMTGAFSQAENTIKSYVYLAEQQNNKTQEIAGVINLSVVYHNTGNYRTSIDLLQRGLENSNISADQKRKLENNLATNLIALQEYEKAQQLIDQALVTNIDINALKNGAQLAIQNGNYAKAEQLLNQAEKFLFKDTLSTSRDLAKLYVEKAQVFSSQQKVKNAIDSYKNALLTLLPLNDSGTLPSTSELYAENTFLDVFDGLAALTQERSLKMSYYHLGTEVAKKLWQSLPDQQAKILHQSTQHLRYERMLAVLFEWNKVNEEQEMVKEGLRISEESKANVLLYSLSQQNLQALHPDDKELQQQVALQQTQEIQINELNQARRLGENTQVIIAGLNRSQLALEQLQRLISKRYPENTEAPLLIDPLQLRLEKEQAQMVHYFFGRNHLYVFHVSGTNVQWKRQPIDESFRNSLASYIGYFDQPNLINDDPIAFSETAYDLHELLQLDMLSAEKKLLIIPDGLLYFVPFDALNTGSSQVFEYAQMPFLFNEYNVGYQTSASIYRDSNIQLKEPKALGMFPVFEGTNRSLTYSLEEANFVSETINTTLFKNEQATQDNFLSNADNHSILHISTHASGGDFIVPAHIEFIDQTLELHELYALSISPQLVVLSACETGVGKVQKGEGAMSLARGFQYAGSKNILFTLWQVNDQTTARWMQLFYEQLASTGNAYDSQYQAKLAYLNDSNIPNAKKSPYYWGAFTYYGTTDPLFEIKTTNWLWFVIGGILLLIMAFYILNRKKTKLRTS